MITIPEVNMNIPAVLALILGATLVPGEAAVTIPQGGVAATLSGYDLTLSFQTTSPKLYTVQTSPDLVQSWTNLPAATQGNGTVKSVTLTNALAGDHGFYRVLIQPPASLILPQSTAFAILGYDCGSISEQVYLTGFDPATGYPTGNVYLSTSCSGSGRGAHVTLHQAWAAATWDLAGNLVSAMTLTTAFTSNPTFLAIDGSGNTIYNVGALAYLVVPLPAAPVGVTAVQSGDQFQVSWLPMGVSPAAVASSTITATPVNSTNLVLTTTVTGPASNAVLSPLQPSTTYQISVVTTSISGSSPASAPVRVTTSPATIPPSAPTVTANWSNLDPTGSTDTLIATWPAANPGNSPIDEYLVKITSDSGSAFTNMVSGTTLTTYFSVDFTPNWSVTVQAHNAFGWGSVSTAFHLGGL
jgi:hypothetical protein